MFPLLLLTTPLLPIIQGVSCLSRQDVLDIVKNMETKMDDETDMMRAEIDKLKTEMENKAESDNIPGAVA